MSPTRAIRSARGAADLRRHGDGWCAWALSSDGMSRESHGSYWVCRGVVRERHIAEALRLLGLEYTAIAGILATDDRNGNVGSWEKVVYEVAREMRS